MMVAAVVPVKNIALAKSRLAGLLSPIERGQLVMTMLDDVFRTVLKCSAVTDIYIVADNDSFAVPSGVKLIIEDRNNGYNEAIVEALHNEQVANSDAMIIIPGDLPLIRVEELDSFISDFPSRGIRIAPARDGDGTNALLLSPPTIMKTQFGIGSFLKHRENAESIASKVEIVDVPGLAFDIDTAQDLIDFCNISSDTETYKFLRNSGVAERL